MGYSMKVSVRGNLSLDSFRLAVDQLIDRLGASDVDRLSSIYLYMVPWSEGLRVDFTDEDGIPSDHITIEPTKRRAFAKKIAVPMETNFPENCSRREVNPMVRWCRGQITSACEWWSLSMNELAVLMKSHVTRLNRFLREENIAVLKREHDRLKNLDRLRRIVELVHPEIDRYAWIMGPPIIPGIEGETLIAQLTLGGTSAFQHLETILLENINKRETSPA